MKNVQIILIFHIVLFVTPLQNTAAPAHHQTFTQTDDSLNQADIKKQINVENIQMEIKKKQEKQIWAEMSEWLKTETAQNYQNVVPDSLNGENFLFQIIEGKEREFVLPNSALTAVNILVRVFEFNEADLTVPNNPAQDSGISFTVSGRGGNTYSTSTIYLKKNIKVEGKEELYKIKVKNNYRKDIVVRISLEKKPKVIKSLDDTKIDPFTTKMKHIMEEIEAGIDDKRMSFKSQMGFMDQEKEQHSNMLILTGLELLTLIASGLVQLFCLKNLIDNKTFV